MQRVQQCLGFRLGPRGAAGGAAGGGDFCQAIRAGSVLAAPRAGRRRRCSLGSCGGFRGGSGSISGAVRARIFRPRAIPPARPAPPPVRPTRPAARCGPFPSPPRGRCARAPCASCGRRSAWRCRSRGSSAITRQISATTSGARPSVASSRISRRGLVISARPIDEHLLLAARELLAAVAEPLGEPREGRQHALEGPVALAVDAGARAHHEVLAHRQVREDAAAFGHVADAAAAPSSRAPGRSRRGRASRTRPTAGAHIAHQRADQRRLAHAVAAEQAERACRPAAASVTPRRMWLSP